MNIWFYAWILRHIFIEKAFRILKWGQLNSQRYGLWITRAEGEKQRLVPCGVHRLCSLAFASLLFEPCFLSIRFTWFAFSCLCCFLAFVSAFWFSSHSSLSFVCGRQLHFSGWFYVAHCGFVYSQISPLCDVILTPLPPSFSPLSFFGNQREGL